MASFVIAYLRKSNDIGAIWIGRGRTPDQRPATITDALALTASDDQFFLRDMGMGALDSAAFHYSIYRSLTRFLGMDGDLSIAYDVPVNFVDAYNTVNFH